MILFAEQTDGVFLLDFPVVDTESEIIERLEYEADREVLRLFRLKLIATLGQTQRAFAAGRCADTRFFGGVLTDVVRPRIGARNNRLVHGDEVRDAEALRPRCTQQQVVERSPAKRDLADGGITEVGEVFVTTSQLHVEVLQHRQRELGEHGVRATITRAVRCRRGVHHVGDERIGITTCSGEANGAVEARIAIIDEGFFASFETHHHAGLAARQIKEIVAGELGIEHRELGLGETRDIDERPRDVGIDATAEGVIRSGRRIVERFLHQSIADAVVRHVVVGRLVPSDRGFPVPRTDFTAEALHDTEHVAVVVDGAISFRPAVVVHQQRNARTGHTRNHRRRQTVWRAAGAERVVVVLRADDQV